jgi:hypothetical protein
MPDDTDILGLPLILPSQAQKHVTHNEALAVLDVVVQLAVLTRNQTVPPTLAAVGDRHIVPEGATVEWAGRDGQVAVMTETGWQFHAPNPGWVAQVLTEGQAAVFDGLAWSTPSEGAASFARLGVSATPDATNRLSVSSPATLLNHAGGGHQLKLNKATATDTASLLFQSGFSGRAELGTAGSDSFSIKVSADGTAWTTALVADAATGRISLPGGAALASGTAALPGLALAADPDSGLFSPGAGSLALTTSGVARVQVSDTAVQVDVPIGGSAVTQSPQDSTFGRLLKVGDYGLGGAGLSHTDWNSATINGAVFMAANAANAPLPTVWFIGSYLRHNSLFGVQEVTSFTGSPVPRTFVRVLFSGSWQAWREVINQGTLVGSVSQAGGVPTGAVIERGSNANGEYVRFADGTQICTRTNLSAANASTALGSLFRSSANVTWTFPAVFAAAPVVSGCCDDADCWLSVVGAPGSTSAALRVISAVTKASALTVRATATGRWF